MSGNRLTNFRGGDRSEYLALFALSRIAYVTPVARQEDFGVADFRCVLARDIGKGSATRFVPGSTFYVQVKSDIREVELSADCVRWFANHITAPLFYCVVDKRDAELSIWSTANLWRGIFVHGEVRARIVMTYSESGHPLPYPTLRRRLMRCPLGPPILRVKLAKIERNPAPTWKLLRKWIEMDRGNLVARDTGRVLVRAYASWKTNRLPSAPVHHLMSGPGYSRAEDAVRPLLIALEHNYQRFSQPRKLDAVRSLLEQIGRPNRSAVLPAGLSPQ